VLVLGGSTTWGFGLSAGQDFPAQLQPMLARDPALNAAAIKVLNLGFNSEGAYSFTQTLNDYDYLDAEVVIFYSGYNDLRGPNYYNFRHRSPLFGLTGYLPLLPSFTVDKLTVWGQQLTGRNERIVFTPPHLDQRNDSSTLRQQLMEIDSKTSQAESSTSASCSPKWQFYCERIVGASELALAKGKRVLVVGEPYISDDHVEEQLELEKVLRSRFAADPRLRYVNLGQAIDLRDSSLCWDGMHLTEAGNRRIAAALTRPVLDMLR
jgi:lysophospholipase L1-like esterase